MERPRILVIDDDPELLESLASALEQEFEIVTARDGREGLAILGSFEMDAVLVDLMMPVLDGEAFLREHMLKHAGVPVIAMSAGFGLPAVERVFRLAGTLQKPFRLADAKAKLRAAIGGAGSVPPSSGDDGPARPPSQPPPKRQGRSGAEAPRRDAMLLNSMLVDLRQISMTR